MRKLIRGIADFRRRNSPEQRSLFARLALGQAPDSLFVCCSDSRVAPNVFASTDPGDLFVVRNMGNLVPPCDAHGKSVSDRSEAAALEFALSTLHVQDVIVCGHSECGAMAALLAGVENIPWPNMRSWIASAGTALARFRAGEEIDPGLSEINRLSQLNVLQQTANLLSYPIVRERVDADELSVHAWWFDIANAEVMAYDPRSHKFDLVDEWSESFAVTGPVKLTGK